MRIHIEGGHIEKPEIEAYKQLALEKHGDRLEQLDITVLNDEEVELTYHLKGQPFERIRRITGYLVGTLDRWNNANKAE